MSSSFIISRDDPAAPASLRHAILAIGNFDGVHRGHQHLIAVARDAARTRECPCAVLTFEPHPRTWFRPENPVFRLTPEAVKLAILERLGLDGAFVRRFDGSLAALSAEDFVRVLLRDALQVAGVVAGHDFHFGRGRQGTPERLAALCRDLGISCTIVPAISEGGEIVSSSAIRAALEHGAVVLANRLLGYRWFVRAAVLHGDKRGRALGYPTANLRLPEECRLRHGIYAVRVNAGGAIHDAVASFGRRPTFDNGAPLLEVHLFDFVGDLYGQPLDVEFVGWIRGEERFESVEVLIARMDEDSRLARGIISRDRSPSFLDPRSA
jgi:riboflavin kinase/FMN adenylyltransferase